MLWTSVARGNAGPAAGGRLIVPLSGHPLGRADRFFTRIVFVSDKLCWIAWGLRDEWYRAKAVPDSAPVP